VRPEQVRIVAEMTDPDHWLGSHQLAARTGSAWEVPEGAVVGVVDVEGSQVADIFLVDCADPSDGLSNGRTFDYNGTVVLTVGARLYSSRSRLLATIVADDVARHDFLFAPCSQEMFGIQYGVEDPHPNCYANLTQALSGFGVPASTVTIPFNAFMATSVASDGTLTIEPPRSRAGDAITFRIERPVFFAVSACSAPTANGGHSGPLLVQISHT
jgi:uncharacterized protein YcgI (DUF1989 family)